MTRLLVMAKAPVPGATKTRLRLSPETAAELQAALVRDTVEKASLLGTVTVAGTPPDRLELLESLLPASTRLVPQAPGDLGERMRVAARSLFEEHPEPVLILGTDAPTLPPDSIRRAERALEVEHPYGVSIVGSADGGYVLLGLEQLYEGLFRGIPWSTNAVYRKTLQRARTLGLSVQEGEPHYDVDTPRDLARLEKELIANPQAAPHTARFLKDLQTRKRRRPKPAPQTDD